MSSKVFFTDFHTNGHENLCKKLQRLMIKAGITNIDFEDKFTCIKMHFGEPGNLAYLRPNYARAVADLIKEFGGKPFLSDANTLYVGRRKNGLEHLDAAYENGFNPFATGCHVIIADGIKGTDEEYVPVSGGEYVENAKIGKAFMDADVFISLTHFKGHELTGFGGTFKNIGMGCGSRAGKMEMHSSGKPYVEQDLCVGCGICAKACAQDAIDINDGKAFIDEEKCVGCGRCIGMCAKDAINPRWDEANNILNYKMAEYTKAVLDGRSSFHISLVVDVSPQCDCQAFNDIPIIPNVGMFASFDPVALDKACVDAVNAQEAVAESALLKAELNSIEHDHFTAMHPDSNWKTCLEHAEKLGMGTQDYELVKI